jgi:tryptophanyl-tRNA synthetase
MERILTGDRPTGPLHLGHYVGSLRNRVKLQDSLDTFIIIADVQALTTHWETPGLLKVHAREVALDNISAGLDPDRASIFIQSMVPAIAELTVLFGLFVTVSRLRHNPTIKTEARQYGYTDMTYGFLGYPVSQAADILFCRANLVPVGEDQLPHVEVTRFVARRFNELYGEVFPEPRALVSDIPRLVGLDGGAKMSKSLGNAIYLKDSPEEVRTKVMSAVTDPARIRKDDPGHPGVCTVFAWHKAFNAAEVPEIESSCMAGTIGCVACKKNLVRVLNDLLDPIRERRAMYDRPGIVEEIMARGTESARREGAATMERVREAMKIDYEGMGAL